jgi:magnesium-transporting ATPase (P-type)
MCTEFLDDEPAVKLEDADRTIIKDFERRFGVINRRLEITRSILLIWLICSVVSCLIGISFLVWWRWTEVLSSYDNSAVWIIICAVIGFIVVAIFVVGTISLGLCFLLVRLLVLATRVRPLKEELLEITRSDEMHVRAWRVFTELHPRGEGFVYNSLHIP